MFRKRRRPSMDRGWGIELVRENGDLINVPIEIEHVEGAMIWFWPMTYVNGRDEIVILGARITHYGQPIAEVPIPALPVWIKPYTSLTVDNLRVVFRFTADQSLVTKDH